VPFSASTYPGLISQRSEAQGRFIAEPDAARTAFDVVIVGSGMGGGLLADLLSDAFRSTGPQKRVLVLEAGSYLFPSHVYNLCRFDNSTVAGRYGVSTVRQDGGGPGGPDHILDQLQLNLGGRTIFWSGLIPQIQPWELAFFPPAVRTDVEQRLAAAGEVLNESESLGDVPRSLATALAAVPGLAGEFDVRETPRALHQPYLTDAGVPAGQYWIEPTGVFNTAELLVNQVGLPSKDPGGPLDLLLNHYVEAVGRRPDGAYEVVAQDVLGQRTRTFTAPVVVLAAGSLGSPKILRRSPAYSALPTEVRALVGKGLTDHPTTSWVEALVTEIAGVPVPPDHHAKIIMYSRGNRDATGATNFPFNVEMNVNARYWHIRENDPTDSAKPFREGEKSIVEFKFSFGNCLDDGNDIVFDNPYRPNRVLSTCKDGDRAAVPLSGYVGQNGKGFGHGTVHHAVGTLRMPARTSHATPDFGPSVVDTDLRVHGEPGLYVCDMSVLPFSSAANPVRALTALTLRLAERLIGS
jgi:choline dehydrogenase-like flavoprotein